MKSRGTRRNQVHRNSSALILPLPIEKIFVREAAEIRWLAGTIADAVPLAQSRRHVSPETVWIQRATVRAAVEGVRSQLRRRDKNRPHAIGVGALVRAGGARKRTLRAGAIDSISADCDALEHGQIQPPSATVCGFADRYCPKSKADGNRGFSCRRTRLQPRYSSNSHSQRRTWPSDESVRSMWRVH